MAPTSPSHSLWEITLDEAFSRADTGILQLIKQGKGQWTGEPLECSRSQIQRLIEGEQVHINQRPLKANSALKPGDQISIQFPSPKPLEVSAENIPIDIIFQDEHLLVVNKPQDLTVHPSDTQASGTLVNALLHHIKDLSGIGGVLRPGIVHRIDKNTSGALVISKSDKAHRALVEIFSKHEIQREYWALCYSSPSQKQGRIESLIGRNPNDRKKMSMQVQEGRQAVTHYELLEIYRKTEKKGPFASWIQARLETGRTHQVRVHLTSLGCSLLGDPTYGLPSENQPKWKELPVEIQEAVKKLPGQALHARTLGFRHPITGQSLLFEAEPPLEFKSLLSALKKYS